MGWNWPKVRGEIKDMHDAEAARQGSPIEAKCPCGQKLQLKLTPEQLAKNPKVRCPSCRQTARFNTLRDNRP